MNEDVLERTYTEAIRKIVDGADEIIEAIKKNAGEMMSTENSAAIDAVDQQIIEVQEAVLDLHKKKRANAITAEDYATQLKKFSDDIHNLEALQDNLHATATRYAEVNAWLGTFKDSVQSGEIYSATDAAIMKQMVAQIIVDDDGIELQLKCGSAVKQEYVK